MESKSTAQYGADLPLRALGVLVLMTVSTASCTPEPHQRIFIGSEDCYLCHYDNYVSVTEPVHVGTRPRTCWTCHSTDGWSPAQEAYHPEEAFPRAEGHHSGIDCVECHDASRGWRSNGANTNCTGCHLGVHQLDLMTALHQAAGVPNFPENPEEPNFCLSCHPDGSYPPTLHPNDRFPITSGNHNGFDCLWCHDTSRGTSANGANTDCTHCHIGAHPRDRVDALHQGVYGYPEDNPTDNFCLACHQHGNADVSMHPEHLFPITSGAHRGRTCSECHNATISPVNSRENTDCVGCHLGEHAHAEQQIVHSVQGNNSRFHDLQASGSPHFCLECHPHGRPD